MDDDSSGKGSGSGGSGGSASGYQQQQQHMHAAYLFFSLVFSTIFFQPNKPKLCKINSFRATTVNGYKWHCYNQIGRNNRFRKMCTIPVKKNEHNESRAMEDWIKAHIYLLTCVVYQLKRTLAVPVRVCVLLCLCVI